MDLRSDSSADLPPPSDGAELRVATDARWWPAVARLILDLGCGARSGARSEEANRDLRQIVVLVPGFAHAAPLRAALHAALGGQACIAPRIQTLGSWAGSDATQGEGAAERRAELFEALHASAWVRERFGSQPGALWSLARDLALLGDELTLAACGADAAFEGHWRQAVQRHFTQRAAAAAEPQSQLVLALWRAGASAPAGAAALRRRLEALAQAASGPLVWLLPQGAQAWQRAYARAYRTASGHGAWLVTGDPQALAASHCWLAAAWPELGGGAGAAVMDLVPVHARAAALAAALPSCSAGVPAASAARPMQILRCESLEQEADAAACWTVERLQAGDASVALVALDRLTARRVRALLERAGVLVADESGWRLSTTSAAAAVMRWLDLVLGDCSGADLIDWMHSPFTLSAEADKAGVVAAARAALIEDRTVSGRQAVLAALERRARSSPAQDGDGDAQRALRIAQELLELARQWQRPATLARFLELLDMSLERMGMGRALARDPVGLSVLQDLAALRPQRGAPGPRLQPAEFRAFLAEHFEHTSAIDSDVDSPVLMTTLTGARLRRFDSALLLGADADHLPAARAAGGLMADAVRRDLGLRSARDAEREQMLDLAGLLASCGRVDATWRCRRGDEPVPLAPPLERLALVAELAGAEALVRSAPSRGSTVGPAVSPARAPSAPALLPASVSASAYQDLVDCPYRFFASRMLGLREAPRLRARPDRRDLGQLLHEVLHEFHRTQPEAVQDQASERRRLRALIDSAFAPLLAQQPGLVAYRQRLRQMVPGYVSWEAQSRSEGWRWEDGEKSLERPLLLGEAVWEPGTAAPALSLRGRLDRIDRNESGARRVLDYKSGALSSLRQGQRDAGEKIQLIFYGLLLDPPPQQAAFLSLQRPPDPLDPAAGVANLVAAPQPLAEHAAALQARLAGDLGRIAAGAPLPANGVEAVCRRCEFRSLCRHGFTAPEAATAGGAAP
jgi:ATP-dependent helicase/nuclease subunit B